MCRGPSMATTRIVIIVITTVSVSVVMGAAWENGNAVLAKPPTLTVGDGSSQVSQGMEIRGVIQEAEDQSQILNRVFWVAMPTRQHQHQHQNHHHQKQWRQKRQLLSLQQSMLISKGSKVSVSNHNNNGALALALERKDSQWQPQQQKLHSSEESLPLSSSSSISPLPLPLSTWSTPRSRLPHPHGHFPPFLGTLNSQESTISGGGGGTDSQKLLRDAKSQSKHQTFSSSSSSSAAAAAVVNSIRCVCDTLECASNGENACLTSGMCYTQFLDRGDESRKLIRGCISGSTPLLCENRRPTSAQKWPYLRCCNSDMCNAGGLTIPPTHLDLAAVNHSAANEEPFGGGHHAGAHPDPDDSIRQDDILLETPLANRGQKSGGSREAFMSPLAKSFLIGAAVTIAVVSAIGFYMLRRELSREASYYRKDLEQEPDVDEDRGIHNETCLSSPVNTEETIDYEPNLISISIPCHQYQLQQCHPPHSHHPLSAPQAIRVISTTTTVGSASTTAAATSSTFGCSSATDTTPALLATLGSAD